jgi:hypothetical protein
MLHPRPQQRRRPCAKIEIHQPSIIQSDAARLKLATALLSIASEDSRDVQVLKRAAQQRMALDYRIGSFARRHEWAHLVFQVSYRLTGYCTNKNLPNHRMMPHGPT